MITRCRVFVVTFASALAVTLPAVAQTGWSRNATDYGSYYISDNSSAQVLILLFWEMDQKNGTNLVGMQDRPAIDVIGEALKAAPFKIEQIVAEDITNQRSPKVSGYVTTPQGRKAFAATLSNRGISRRLVVMLDDPANINRLPLRIGSASNFSSAIPEADRPGWVPGQGNASPGSYADPGMGAKGALTPAPPRVSKPANRQAAAQRTLRPRGNYTLPNDQSDFYKWPQTGPVTYSPNVKDPLAPRGYIGSTGPKFGVSTHDGAFKKLLEYGNIVTAGTPVSQRLKPWVKFDKRDARLVMVPSVRGGQKGVLMAFISSVSNSPEFGVLGYEVPEQAFLDGGGIIRMMLIRGIIPSADVFPKETQDRIARAPFKQQMAFYEAALDKLYESEKRKFVATQGAVTLRMMELNYDLLLGGDISSPFIGD